MKKLIEELREVLRALGYCKGRVQIQAKNDHIVKVSVNGKNLGLYDTSRKLFVE